MLEMAQEMFKALQDRFRTTLRVMADLAESVGVPPTVTTLFTGGSRVAECCAEESWTGARRAGGPGAERASSRFSGAPQPSADDGDGRQVSSLRPGAVAAATAQNVRGLRVDDAIEGSTYLARIVWSLGVAELEGTGPLRPADMARMIMSRSPVSLEPPNVARYIRRSKPTCIEVAHTEGSSSYYRLNAQGKAIFEELFRIKS